MVDKKPEKKHLVMATELPFSGRATSYMSERNLRKGQAWDLRLYDGHGEPPVKIIKQDVKL